MIFLAIILKDYFTNKEKDSKEVDKNIKFVVNLWRIL